VVLEVAIFLNVTPCDLFMGVNISKGPT